MNNRVPHVKDVYFQHKVLTRIFGQPTYELLKTLMDKLKANASSVPTTLGGGAFGHLGLLLSPARYATILATPYAHPGNPGVFNPPPQGTGPQIEAAQDVWRNAHLTFKTTQATEKALMAQVVDAIDATYLAALRNSNTSCYGDSIRALTDHLFATYGRISPQQVKTRELEIFNIPYDLSQPVDVIFNAIDDLLELADHAGIPMSPDQLVNLAYVIFARQPILLQDLCAWNKKQVADKTWTNMKLHMREAQTDLSSLPVAGSLYPNAHQANFANLSHQVHQRLIHDQAPYGTPSFHPHFPAPPSVYPPPYDAPPLEPISGPPSEHSSLTDTFSAMANSLQRRKQDLQSRESQMLSQMQDMMSKLLSQGTQQTNPSTNNQRNSKPNGSSNQSNGRPARSSHKRHYCWSHGACAHNGNDCHTRATGHQTAATFSNMMGGSVRGCYWIPKS